MVSGNHDEKASFSIRWVCVLGVSENDYCVAWVTAVLQDGHRGPELE